MKSVHLLTTIIALLSSLFSHSQSDSTTRTWFDTTYFQLDSIRLWRTIDQPAYIIQMPTDWILYDSAYDIGADLALCTYQETLEDSFTENVTVLRHDLHDEDVVPDLFTYTERSYSLLSKAWKDFKEEENVIETHGQETYHKWVYSGADERHRMKFVQYTFIKDKVVYIITLTTEAEKFYRYKDVGEKILNSFSFK